MFILFTMGMSLPHNKQNRLSDKSNKDEIGIHFSTVRLQDYPYRPFQVGFENAIADIVYCDQRKR